MQQDRIVKFSYASRIFAAQGPTMEMVTFSSFGDAVYTACCLMQQRHLVVHEKSVRIARKRQEILCSYKLRFSVVILAIAT